MTLLNGDSSLFGLSLSAWAAGSPWIVASIFVGIHMLIGMAFVDPDRPLRTLKFARTGALITGLLVVAAIFGSLSGRGVDFYESGWVKDAIQWSIWVLVLVLAACGGFMAVMASEHFRQARLAAQLADLETRAEVYEKHIAVLENEIATYEEKPAPSGAPSPAPAGAAGSATAAAVLLVALSAALLLFGMQGVAHAALYAAQESTVTGVSPNLEDRGVASLVAAPAWVVENAHPAVGECDVLIDVTHSISKTERTLAAKMFLEMLPRMLDAYQCAAIRISAFSADDPFQPIQEFVLPTASVSCSTEPAPRGGIQGLTLKMYPDLDKAEESRAKEACSDKQRDAQTALAVPRSKAIREVVAAASLLSETPAVGKCTSLYQATARALQRSQFVVALTDGAQTCDWYKTAGPSPLSIRVPNRSSLLFLLVPSAGERDSGNNRVPDRASQLGIVFPGAVMQLLNEATPRFWERTAATNAKR